MASRKLYSKVAVVDCSYTIEECRNFIEKGEPEQFLLSWACRTNHLKEVKELISLGADLVEDFNEPLESACEEGNLEIVKLLLNLGVRTSDSREWTEWWSLDQAASKGHYKLVKLLLEAGADPAAPRKFLDWNTALKNAVHYNYLDCAQIILDASIESQKTGNLGFVYHRNISDNAIQNFRNFVNEFGFVDTLLDGPKTRQVKQPNVTGLYSSKGHWYAYDTYDNGNVKNIGAFETVEDAIQKIAVGFGCDIFYGRYLMGEPVYKRYTPKAQVSGNDPDEFKPTWRKVLYLPKS
jgi:hypothetical protein